MGTSISIKRSRLLLLLPLLFSCSEGSGSSASPSSSVEAKAVSFYGLNSASVKEAVLGELGEGLEVTFQNESGGADIVAISAAALLQSKDSYRPIEGVRSFADDDYASLLRLEGGGCLGLPIGLFSTNLLCVERQTHDSFPKYELTSVLSSIKDSGGSAYMHYTALLSYLNSPSTEWKTLRDLAKEENRESFRDVCLYLNGLFRDGPIRRDMASDSADFAPFYEPALDANKGERLRSGELGLYPLPSLSYHEAEIEARSVSNLVCLCVNKDAKADGDAIGKALAALSSDAVQKALASDLSCATLPLSQEAYGEGASIAIKGLKDAARRENNLVLGIDVADADMMAASGLFGKLLSMDEEQASAYDFTSFLQSYYQ